MEVTTATYSGRFIRPSIFRQATPSSSSSRRCLARDISFRDSKGRSALSPPTVIQPSGAGRKAPVAAAGADDGGEKH